MPSRAEELPEEDLFPSRGKWMNAFVSVIKNACIDATVDGLGGSESDYYVAASQNRNAFEFKIVSRKHVSYESHVSAYDRDTVYKSAKYAVIYGFNWKYRPGWRAADGKKTFTMNLRKLYESAYGAISGAASKMAVRLEDVIEREKGMLSNGTDLTKDFGDPRLPGETDFDGIPARGSARGAVKYQYNPEASQKDMAKAKNASFRFERPIRDGDAGAIRDMISKGMDVNKLVSGKAPLHAATSRGGLEILKLLLENGADPNVRQKPAGEWTTPLHCIAFGAHHRSDRDQGELKELEEMGRLLIAAGADLSAKNGKGETPAEYLERMQAQWENSEGAKMNPERNRRDPILPILGLLGGGPVNESAVEPPRVFAPEDREWLDRVRELAAG